MTQVVEKLQLYVPGWKRYFELAQTPNIWRRLDEWVRRRLRALQLKQWRTPCAIYRALKALGASDHTAAQVAAYRRCLWHTSDRMLKTVLTVAYFDRLGVPRLT